LFAGDPEFGVDVGEVGFDGAYSDVELGGDLCGGVATGGEGGDLAFASGKRP
jgi:hypothetical protein